MFEDQWPEIQGDLDFNDVVVAINSRVYLNATGHVSSISTHIDPLALGGNYSNGMAWHLPTSAAGATVRGRVGQGPWVTLPVQLDAQLTVILSPDLRELFGGLQGQINSHLGGPDVAGQMLAVEVTFDSPRALNTGSWPFDLFIFRAGDFGLQTHFPAYGGTQAMRAALFGTGVDSSSPGRYFVGPNGIPYALDLGATERYPGESVSIETLFPDVLLFAASGGVQNADFYVSNVNSEFGRTAMRGPLPAEPTEDTSCAAVFDHSTTFAAIRAPQIWSVPAGVTSIRIEAAGGEGGTSAGHLGGRAAYVGGTFAVVAGQVLTINVGGNGIGLWSTSPGGGGGGSFTMIGGLPLLIAGGGGGASSGRAGLPGQPGLITRAGGPGGYHAVAEGEGGHSVEGFVPGELESGGGGGGLNSAGHRGEDALGGAAAGGRGGNGMGGYGGYGGGGGAGGSGSGGGGGGGFSGGSAGTELAGGGGGGSFNGGTAQVARSADHVGSGFVTIKW